MKIIWTRLLPALVILSIGAWGYVYLNRPDMTSNPVTARGDRVTIMDFTALESTSNLPSGWWHRTFWTKPAMELSLVGHVDEKKALRCETNGGGSILGRNIDISLADLRYLNWDWFIEYPIISDIDEATEEGDDHPARLFLRFEDSSAKSHYMEIIWSNQKYAPGDYKIIGTFPHYVANGLEENVGSWNAQTVDLQTIYHDISNRDDTPRLKSIAVFCDSDNTGTHSVAYFTDVILTAN